MSEDYAVARSGWRDFHAEDSDDEFDQAEFESWRGKTALLVIIDVSPPMFDVNSWENKEETPFMAAIKCCESIWRTKITSNTSDIVSIILLGTEESNISNFPNIYELQPFSQITVDMIKELMAIKSTPDLNGLVDKIGSSGDYNLKELFWQAKMSFDKAKARSFAKKVIFFTTQDNPHADRPKLQADAEGKFNDLGKVNFSIVALKTGFDYKKFYNKLLPDESSIIYAKNFEGLCKIVRMRQRLKRPVSKSTMRVSKRGMEIAVGVYSFVRPAIPPTQVRINKRNNEVLERKVNAFRGNTGMPILKSEEKRIATIQGETVELTEEDKLALSEKHEPGIQILGFLSHQDFDNFTCYRSPPYFLYPDDERISGSKDLFCTLLRQCHILEKVPIVRYILSRGKGPKMGALIPSVHGKGYQDEDDDGRDEEDTEEKKLFPEGFHLFPLPFNDEVRKYSMDPTPEAPQILVDKMEKLVKKLTNKNFDVLEVKNPYLQVLYKRLESEALELDDEDEGDQEEMFDFTEPNEELMRERLKTLPEEIEALTKTLSKDAKKFIPVAPKIDILMEAKHGRLLQCSNAQLIEFLKERDVELPTFPTKAQLVKMVINSIGIGNYYLSLIE